MESSIQISICESSISFCTLKVFAKYLACQQWSIHGMMDFMVMLWVLLIFWHMKCQWMHFKIITRQFNVVILLPKHLVFMGRIHVSNILILSSFILTIFMCKSHLPLLLCSYICVKFNHHINSKAFEIHGINLCYQYFDCSLIHYCFF